MSIEISLKMLRNIRELDSIIDFSRATLQLHIVLVLSRYRHGLTADDIAFKTGFRRKTVLDTLRKLEIKGLVVRRDDLYLLSDIGVKYLEQLEKLLKVKKAERSSEKDLREVACKLVFYGTLRDLIVLLGRSKGLTLEKMSHILGVSPKKVRNYITYLNNMSKTKLVKTVRRRSLLGVRKTFVLTAYGRRLYSNIASMSTKNLGKNRRINKLILYSSLLGVALAVSLLPMSLMASIGVLLAVIMFMALSMYFIYR